MTTAIDERLMLERLEPLLASGRQRAAELGRPVVVSLTARLDGLQPEEIALSGDYFVWQQPSHDVSMVALGQAVRLTGEGESRFDTLRRRLACLQSDAFLQRDEGVAAPPFCLAGFAFDPAVPDDGAWQGFPDGLAVVPRLLFLRRDGASSVTLNVEVSASTDDAAELTLLRALLSAAMTQPAHVIETTASALESDEDASQWYDSVAALTGRIAEGAAQKVVLARRLEVKSARPFDVRTVLSRLRQRYPDCTIFAAGNDASCFLGATPETLVRLHGHEASMDCLAGTTRRGKEATEDEALGAALLADDKERREHGLVMRGMVEALQGISSKMDLPTEPVLRRTANVQHLHTPIRATIEADRHVLDLVERLHPTPATAGLPRAKSLCLIREHERFSRGWYAGPIGWIDADGGGEFAVALRSGLLRGNNAYLYAGCGIVTGSDPRREYEESRVKLQAMLWALNATS